MNVSEKCRELYREGMKQSEIARRLGVSNDHVTHALRNGNLGNEAHSTQEIKAQTAIKILDIQKYIDTLEVGNMVTVYRRYNDGEFWRVEKLRTEILHKYPHVIETAVGVYQHKEIYAWQRGWRFI